MDESCERAAKEARGIGASAWVLGAHVAIGRAAVESLPDSRDQRSRCAAHAGEEKSPRASSVDSSVARADAPHSEKLRLRDARRSPTSGVVGSDAPRGSAPAWSATSFDEACSLGRCGSSGFGSSTLGFWKASSSTP